MKRVSNRDAQALIKKREPFTNATARPGPHIAGRPHPGSFRATTWFEGRGHLPEQFVLGTLLAARYIVYSYNTPLAWWSEGQWYYASVAYSPTTSKHQHHVRVALAKENVIYVGGDWREVPGAGRFWDGSPKVNASTGTPSHYFGFGTGDAS